LPGLSQLSMDTLLKRTSRIVAYSDRFGVSSDRKIARERKGMWWRQISREFRSLVRLFGLRQSKYFFKTFSISYQVIVRCSRAPLAFPSIYAHWAIPFSASFTERSFNRLGRDLSDILRDSLARFWQISLISKRI